MTVPEILDHSSLHCELDQIEGNKPDDILPAKSASIIHSTREKIYPNPNDTNPTTGDFLDIREAPIGKASNDRGHKLRQTERTHQCVRWTLHKEESMRASYEDQRLRNYGNLKIDDHVQLLVVMVNLTRGGIQMDVELALEEIRLEDYDNENDPMQTIRILRKM